MTTENDLDKVSSFQREAVAKAIADEKSKTEKKETPKEASKE